ncbi:MAG: hypothetical protein V1678_01135 [Candidatus Aenigmatarchaeota archaeon]
MIDFYFSRNHIVLIALGWLDGIFGKDRKEEKVSLRDVESLVADKIEKDMEPLKESIRDGYGNLQTVANTMKEDLKALEQATYPEGTYQALISISVGRRKTFINKMDFVVRQLQKPIGKDTASIINFYEGANRLINATNAETIEEYALLKILFEKEGKDVLQSFRQIFEINGELGKMVSELREHDSKLSKVKGVVSEIQRLTEELGKDESRLDKALKAKEDGIRKAEDDIGKLLQSGEWKALLEMQKSRDDMKAQMGKKKAEFMECISRLEVPLKKYNWSAKSRILDSYILKSFDSILCEDPKGDALMSALRDMKIRMIEGEMKLKDSDRFLAAIDDAKETIVSAIEDYLRLSGELKELEEKIALQDVLKRKAKLEIENSRLGKEAEEIENERKTAEEQKKKSQAAKEQKINELKDMIVNILGKSIPFEVK